jgi:uncharacterized protein YdeI (YjbR/CyaY-like superfamily)
MITTPAEYFAKGCGRCTRFATAECSVQGWAAGLAALRQLCLSLGLEETAKWGHPCYMYAGRNICIIGAFRGDFRLSFFNAALMQDQNGLLRKQGPNTQHADCLRFTSEAEVKTQAAVVLAYLDEAMGYAKAGILAPKAQGTLELPVELVDALDADPELAEAFARLTPGRQKSYVIHLAGAKTAATREARIARCRAKIIAGKGFNDYF